MDDFIIKQAYKKYSTPFYLYDKKCIIDHAEKLKCVLFKNADIFFSMKANPLIGIMKIFISMGYGIEVASKGEMVKALKAGCKNSNIIFSGPGKEKREIEYAVDNEIYCINVENLTEIQIIEAIAAQHNKIVNVGLRINPSEKSKGKISMSGDTQFGISIEEINTAVLQVNGCKHLNLIGFQIYMGTQILDAEEIIKNTEKIIEITYRIVNQNNLKIEYINFGGGFGVPYFTNDKILDMDKLKIGLDLLYEKHQELHNIKRIVFESGRFLLAESGCFVTQILYKKKMNNTTYLICDGGSNFHSASAFLGRFIRNNFPMHSITTSDETEIVTVVGNLCTPTDVIGQNVMLNKAAEEDYIVIEKSGAYGLTYSPYGFLGHDIPKEILYDHVKGYTLLRDNLGNDAYESNEVI